MKQQETRSPKVGEPRNENPGQKKRFLIVKLEERIAPKKHNPPTFCLVGCSGIQG